MYISNPEVLSHLFICNKPVAKYLINNKMPILSNQGNFFYFSDTSELQLILDKMPWWIKVVSKCKKF